MGIRHKRSVPALGLGIVVLALLVPAFAVSGGFDAKSGQYAHTPSSQNHSVTFKVTKRDRVKDVQFELLVAFSQQCIYHITLPGHDKISSRGKFHISGRFAGGRAHDWIKGKFVSRTKAKGKVHGEGVKECRGSVTEEFKVHRVK